MLQGLPLCTAYRYMVCTILFPHEPLRGTWCVLYCAPMYSLHVLCILHSLGPAGGQTVGAISPSLDHRGGGSNAGTEALGAVYLFSVYLYSVYLYRTYLYNSVCLYRTYLYSV